MTARIAGLLLPSTLIDLGGRFQLTPDPDGHPPQVDALEAWARRRRGGNPGPPPHRTSAAVLDR